MKSDRLYTWTDVQNEIFMDMNEKNCPPGIKNVRIYWDGLYLSVEKENKDDALRWLTDIFESRFQHKDDTFSLILDSLRGKERILEIHVETEEEQDEEENENIRFRPLLSKPTVITPNYFVNDPPEIESDIPPIFAFHSFKGGVGRTVHAIAFALLFNKVKNQKVLLIDADLEAPGITWMLEETKRKLDISFADMLALVHSDSDENAEESIDLIAERIQNIHLDNIYVLPAFRSSVQYNSLEVRPENLIRYSDDPYILTRLIGKLGKKLNVRAVIIDLRAGLSEISSGFLLDPRIHRIFVSTLSDQSLTGTCHELEFIGKFSAISKKHMPHPGMILSMIPQETKNDRNSMEKYKEKIQNSFRYFFKKTNNSDAEEDSLNSNSLESIYPLPTIYETSFDQELLILPKYWDEVVSRIENSKIPDAITGLKDRLRLITSLDIRYAILDINPEDQMKKFIKEYNEKIKPNHVLVNDFFISNAGKRLVSDFSNKVPIAVVSGNRKAGRTTFFYHLMRKQSWKSTVKDITGNSFDYNASVVPLRFAPSDFSDKKTWFAEDKREKAAKILNTALPDKNAVWEFLFTGKDNFSEKQWLEYWLNFFAWNIGFHTNKTDAGERLLETLVKTGKDMIFVFDLDSDKEYTQKIPKAAFRVLTALLPKWLEKYPQRPLGLIAFCSDSFLEYVFEDNIPDFIQSSPYRLKTDMEEAIRFASFLMMKSELLRLEKKQVYELSLNELIGKIEIYMKDEPLNGMQLEALFHEYSRHNNLTPYLVVSFFIKLFDVLLENRQDVKSHEAAVSIMKTMIKDRML